MPTPLLVTADAASVWTGRPRGTIWRWAAEGRITRYRRGRRTLYDLYELPPLVDGVPGELPPIRRCGAA